MLEDIRELNSFHNLSHQKGKGVEAVEGCRVITRVQLDMAEPDSDRNISLISL